MAAPASPLDNMPVNSSIIWPGVILFLSDSAVSATRARAASACLSKSAVEVSVI
jgi:hypothetical protein